MYDFSRKVCGYVIVILIRTIHVVKVPLNQFNGEDLSLFTRYHSVELTKRTY